MSIPGSFHANRGNRLFLSDFFRGFVNNFSIAAERNRK